MLNENVKISILTKNISFKDYLTTFYAPSFDLKLLPIQRYKYFVENQHKELKHLFKALYFGDSIPFSLREKLSTLGLSHLVALSGLHLGFISLFLYFVFSFFYKPIHYYFPYRNRLFDIGVMVLVVEFLYLYLTSFPPSLIRAFVLEVLIFVFAVRLKDVFSLRILFLVVFFSFLLFGFKIFSIGYFLSIVGVFYIYLFFNYFKPTFLNSVFLSFYLYVAMFAIVHYFFGNFNYYQLFSPIISLLFTVFYPLSILLHLFGIGGIFDNILQNYFALGIDYTQIHIPLFLFLIALTFSLLAFFKREVFYLWNLFNLGVVIFYIGG